MIHEFNNPLPVHTDLGDGMALYVRDGGTFANDVWAVVLNDGSVRHFRTDQVWVAANGTFDIKADHE